MLQGLGDFGAEKADCRRFTFFVSSVSFLVVVRALRIEEVEDVLDFFFVHLPSEFV